MSAWVYSVLKLKIFSVKKIIMGNSSAKGPKNYEISAQEDKINKKEMMELIQIAEHTASDKKQPTEIKNHQESQPSQENQKEEKKDYCVEDKDQDVDEINAKIRQKRQWPQNHINLVTLPEIKTHGKMKAVKKTKQSIKKAQDNLEQIQQLQFVLENKQNPKIKQIDDYTIRGRTAPLLNQFNPKEAQNIMMEMAKTKRCRVSRML